MNAVKKGHKGETIAALDLQSNGYQIVRRNFRCRTGEIDIVASLDDVLAIVEVKSWDSYSTVDLQYSISRDKKATIVQTTKQFLCEHPEFRNYRIRFDVMLVTPQTGEIEHFEHAFTETGNAW